MKKWWKKIKSRITILEMVVAYPGKVPISEEERKMFLRKEKLEEILK